MAAFESTQFVPFAFPAFPLPTAPFSSRNSPCPSDATRAIPSLNAGGRQEICSPAAIFSRSGCQIEAERSTAARAEGRWHAPADNENESDDFPSPEELSRAVLRPKISTEASKTRPTASYLEQPAVNRAGLQADRAQSGSGERQGGSRDDPMILDSDADDLDKASAGDEAEGGGGRLELDAGLHNPLPTLELASAPTDSIDTSGPWYDVEEGRYIEDTAPGLESHEQHSVPSALALVEPALDSLPEPSDKRDDGWTEEKMAELEKELGLALGEAPVESPLAGAPTSSPYSIEAPQDETQGRERGEPTGGIPGELRDASRHGSPAQDLELGEQWETQAMAEGRAVAMMQQQEELAAPKEELGRAAVGDQQDVVEVVDADDPEDKEATEALLAAQSKIPEIKKHRFRLRGVRARRLAGRQTKTTQYRVVWGEHPNRSDFWVNEEDMQMSMLQPPRERSFQGLAPRVERDVMRVYCMRSNRRSNGKKIFEYQVDAFGLDDPWITEDQLRISLSPMLVAELEGPPPLSQAQLDVLLRHSATATSPEYRSASRASCSSAPADPAPEGEPATRKRGHQDAQTEISSDTHHAANTDDSHSACDTSDEGPRPTKRRKPRSARAVTPPRRLRQPPPQGPPPPPPPTTRHKIDEAQSQDDHRCSSIFIDEQHCASRTSRSPSAALEAGPVAESQEWPFQGFLKRTRIGDNVTYNLEFRLPSISEHLHLLIDPAALDINHDSTHSGIYQAPLKPKRSNVPWTDEEDAKLLRMWNEGRSWEYIFAELPHRSEGTIRVRCSTKFKRRPRTRAGGS